MPKIDKKTEKRSPPFSDSDKAKLTASMPADDCGEMLLKWLSRIALRHSRSDPFCVLQLLWQFKCLICNFLKSFTFKFLTQNFSLKTFKFEKSVRGKMRIFTCCSHRKRSGEIIWVKCRTNGGPQSSRLENIGRPFWWHNFNNFWRRISPRTRRPLTGREVSGVFERIWVVRYSGDLNAQTIFKLAVGSGRSNCIRLMPESDTSLPPECASNRWTNR